MGDRYFCFKHREPMTRSRPGNRSLVWSCESCVAAARAIVHPLIAASEEKRAAKKGEVWHRNRNSESRQTGSAIRR